MSASELKSFHTILLTERGSITYGTQISEEEARAYGIKPSDTDYMRVVMAPVSRVLSIQDLPEAATYKEPHDEEVHELRHFLRLCTRANPNILECLAVEEENVKLITSEGKLLRENVHLFFNKEPVYAAFYGYSQQQMKRYVLREKGDQIPEGRRELWERFGYDTKAASHVARLIYQGAHLLETGVLRVKLPPEVVMAVKSMRLGKFPKREAVELLNEGMEYLRKAYERSKLPKQPSLKLIDQLYRRILAVRYQTLRTYVKQERWPCRSRT